MNKMKSMILMMTVVALQFFPVTTLNAQVTERTRPEAWSRLVPGARFADRFEPMPAGRTGNGWGWAGVQGRYVDNGIECPTLSFWGGNILRGDDGKYHLMVCGWREDAPKGHMSWSSSTVLHTVADNPTGPYRIVGNIGAGHNPEAFRLADGRYVVYVIDGYYLADSLQGPWMYGHFTFDSRDRRIIEGLTNLTFAPRQDHSVLMVCRGGGVWISRDGLSPYHQLTDHRVYPAVEGCFEDPVVWRDSLQYHLIVNDWMGRVAFYERSLDGLHWVIEDGEAYMPGIARHADGKVEEWYKFERMKVLQDEYGRAVQANFAVIDTIKWEDHAHDNHSSKNICIPLNPGLRMEVTDHAPIESKTRKIHLLVKADRGGKPLSQIDMQSLRFGTHSEVNYGRGAKAVKMKPCDGGVMITFDAKGSGITAAEFAPKLIGRYKDGSLVYGYARLPYVEYKPAILSARRPIFSADSMTVEVQNFGLSASRPCKATVLVGGKRVADINVAALQPYAKCTIQTNVQADALTGNEAVEVVFVRNGQTFDRNIFTDKETKK